MSFNKVSKEAEKILEMVINNSGRPLIVDESNAGLEIPDLLLKCDELKILGLCKVSVYINGSACLTLTGIGSNYFEAKEEHEKSKGMLSPSIINISADNSSYVNFAANGDAQQTINVFSREIDLLGKIQSEIEKDEVAVDDKEELTDALKAIGSLLEQNNKSAARRLWGTVVESLSVVSSVITFVNILIGFFA